MTFPLFPAIVFGIPIVLGVIAWAIDRMMAKLRQRRRAARANGRLHRANFTHGDKEGDA